MPKRISDPRRFDRRNRSPLGAAADEIAAASPHEQKRLLLRLSRRLSTLLDKGEENAVRDALRNPPSAPASDALLQALELALSPAVASGGVGVRVFAIPVLFVVGATAAARIHGVVADTGAIQSLFETAGTLGHCRNFGLSNALADLGSVENLSWSTLYAIAHGDQWHGLAGLDLPPADIAVTANTETVHLRFIVGAALTPADAPGFVESAGDIGRWGMSLTQMLDRQLAAQDISLLAIPRPPRSVVLAAKDGWHVAREMGFQLFLSNALRQARLRTGEPDVTISACSDNSIRIHLTSPFDDLFDHTYIWPLAASDPFDTIVSSIFSLLTEARVERFEVRSAIEEISDAKVAPH